MKTMGLMLNLPNPEEEAQLVLFLADPRSSGGAGAVLLPPPSAGETWYLVSLFRGATLLLTQSMAIGTMVKIAQV